MEKFDWQSAIRSNFFVLKTVGLWPQGSDGYELNLYTLYSLISVNLFLNLHNFFQAANIIFVYNDLEAAAALFLVTVTDVLASVKVFYFVSNIKMLKTLMVKLDNEMLQPRNTEQLIIIKKGLKSWKMFYVSFWLACGVTLVLWIMFPVMDGSYQNGRLPISAWYPYDFKETPFYEMTYVYQVISMWFLASANLNMDTLMVALLMYVGVQCEILGDNLSNLQVYLFNEKLILCIEHHKKIVSFAENCNEFFDKIVLGQFFTSGLSLAMSMFQLTLVEPTSIECFSLLFYVSAMTLQVYLYCWFGNEVEIKTPASSIRTSVRITISAVITYQI